MDVPDGIVDPDTLHCRAAIDGDCAPASIAVLLAVAGVRRGDGEFITENHLHYGLGLGGPDGTTAGQIQAALATLLAGTAWTTAVAFAFDAAVRPQPAGQLLGYVKSTGAGHMVCVVPGPGGAWLHDPADDERQLLSWEQVAGLRPNLVVKLLARGA